MNDTQIIVSALTLLYRESQAQEESTLSKQLVKSVMDDILLPEGDLALGGETLALSGLKRMVLNICSEPKNIPFEKTELLQKIRLCVGDESAIYQSIEIGLMADLTEEQIKHKCVNLRGEIKAYSNEQKIFSLINAAARKTKFERNTIQDVRAFAADLINKLDPFQSSAKEHDPAIVSQMDFGNMESIAKVFESVQKEVSGTSILKTGWQGVNRMFAGGLRGGQECMVAALPHNFKSQLSMNLFRQVATYNTPELINPAKKPAIVYFTFEDELENSLKYIYKQIHENKTGKKLDEREYLDKSAEDLAVIIASALGATGFHIHMFRVNPSDWTLRDFFNKILELEAQGFEIKLCVADYLCMMPTTGCVQGAAGIDLRDMFRRARNFFSARKTCFWTPHQLSPSARNLVRQGELDLVKKLVGQGHTAGSSQIDQELDLEVYIHIEYSGGKPYMTMQRGKHRGVGETPLIDRYVVYEMQPIADIPDDINSQDMSRRKVGGGLVGTAEETPWFQTERDMEF
jgi:hypothetical protein